MNIRSFIALSMVLASVAACGASDEPLRAYEVRGIVSELSEDGESIVLAHEQIADYMPAMTMEFPLGHPDLDDGLVPGDQVRFQIVVDASGSPIILRIEEELLFSGPFPEFVLPTPAGETLDSDLIAGTVAVVNFWASWCAPCREEMPVLQRLYSEYRDHGLVVLGVNEDPENEAAIDAQIEDLAIDYPIVLGDGELENALGGVFQIPTTYVLDRQGNVVNRHIGLFSEGAFRSEIEALLDDPTGATDGE